MTAYATARPQRPLYFLRVCGARTMFSAQMPDIPRSHSRFMQQIQPFSMEIVWKCLQQLLCKGKEGCCCCCCLGEWLTLGRQERPHLLPTLLDNAGSGVGNHTHAKLFFVTSCQKTSRGILKEEIRNLWSFFQT